MSRRLALCLLLLAAPQPAQEKPEPLRTTVGMPVQLRGLVLPGTELEPIAATTASKVLVRIEQVHRHGTAHRYDLAITGLEAGEHDLRAYLQRKDQTETSDLPAIPVIVTAVRPAKQTEPNAIEGLPAPRLGGYRTWQWVLGGAWVLGLLLLLFGWRRRAAAAAVAAPPPTLAERLRPIVTEAIAGTLPAARRAELELLLLGFWRQRLQLERRPAAEAIQLLREHAEAGVLLRQLELWLHAPPRQQAVDVEALLRPYAALPARSEEGAA